MDRRSHRRPHGRGIWTLVQNGETAEIGYDWSVRSDRLLFRLLAPFFRRLMISNHRWAMARGKSGLQVELIRQAKVRAAPAAPAGRV
jgi:hypothetical protein